MEDIKIIELYNSRKERAIEESQNKYGLMLYKIAYNILFNNMDSEEVINDTYYKAWHAIPPEKPRYLGAYLGKITRNLSINLWNHQRAKKRYDGVDLILDELSECVPDINTVEKEIEGMELTDIINKWLDTLPSDNRLLFLRRYWYGDSISVLAKEAGLSNNKISSRLYRLRQALKDSLEREGISL